MRVGVDAAVLPVLEPGERLLWSGRPGIRMRLGELALGLFLLIWSAGTGLAVWRGGFDAIEGIFLAFGVVGLARVLVYTPLDRSRLVYAVTDRRVLFVHGAVRRRVDEYALRGMTAENVVVRAVEGGRGTVGFADFSKRCGYDGDQICMPEFIAILGATDVADLIRRAVAAAGVASWRIPRANLNSR